MSIINDALKRVQENQEPRESQQEQKPATALPASSSPSPWGEASSQNISRPSEIPATQSEPQELKARGSKFISTLALMCAVLITYSAVLFIYKQFTKGLSPHPRLAQKATTKPLASVTIPAGSQAKTNRPVVLNIQGVMRNETGNLVLINDEVYQQGDVVDGAKILKIDLNAVTVLVEGKQETIAVGT